MEFQFLPVWNVELRSPNRCRALPKFDRSAATLTMEPSDKTLKTEVSIRWPKACPQC